VLHDRIYFLARLVGDRNQGFALRWATAPEPASAWRSSRAPDAATPPGAAALYPRPKDARARGLEGYVDLRRLAIESPCLALSTPLGLPPATGHVTYRFAASGPAELWWDERLLVRTERPGMARFDEAVEGVIGSSPAEGTHRLAVRSCGPPTVTTQEPRGFFLHLTASSGPMG
jgi:hypothetical protein